jgi:hypothetical protein
MIDKAENRTGRRARAWLVPAVAIAAAGALAGCGDLFDVENPNNLVQDDVEQPEAGGAVSNGALSTVARGIGEYVVAAATASDEARWIGSRDAWFDLDQGNLDNPSNEFTDDAWDWISEGRWLADEAIRLLELQDADGTIVDRGDLGRAYLWAGIIYTYIADWLEDYTFSDRATSAPPIGEGNMDQVYDDAIAYLNQAESVLNAEGESGLAIWAVAQRARTKHGKAVWQMLDPPGSVPSNPLVGSGSGAVSDALQAIQAVGGSLTAPIDTRWFFNYSSATVDNDLGWQINERLEHRFGSRYVDATDDNKKRGSTSIMDPIDNVPAPGADFMMDRHEAGGPDGARYAPQEITSVREMLLIIAEANLADGNTSGFVTAINGLRAMDGLSPYDPATHTVDFFQYREVEDPSTAGKFIGEPVPGTSSSDSNLNLLLHHRFEQLMLTGRLLNDHYRFGIESDLWLGQSKAVNVPGTIFPISIGERESNTCISIPGSC